MDLREQQKLMGPPLPEKLLPTEEVLPDDSWFSIDSINPDNMRHHLEATPAQQAWLSEAVAAAEYNMRVYEDAATTREAHVFMLYKCRPFNRIMAKNRGVVSVDASDDVCRMAAKCDLVSSEYRILSYQWRQRRDALKGCMSAMETKRTFLASLCGLRRAEWDAENLSGRQ